ncbi:MAG TPA: nitroreductase family protein [Ignavibacteriaceae bacterium]|nr:nitroreductase family protein [Ignavibacteriaceae bacterium]
MLHDLIEKRYSPRAFSDEEIEEEKILCLLEAARLSPSSMNAQPWRFIVGRKGHGDTHSRILETLMDANKIWAKNAQVLILGISKITYDNNSRNGHAEYDLGQAMANLTFQASALNLFVHQMGGFSPGKASEIFKIPENYKPVTVAAVGYLGDPDILPDKLKDRENAPRKRKDLSDLIFEEKFGEPSKLIETTISV